VLAGIELADSVTIDAHKWLATTMGCGMFLTRHLSLLPEAFHASASYMPSASLTSDPYLTSAQWSRRFIGLRLFLSLATGGWQAHAAHVEHSLALAERLASGMRARGWRVVNSSDVGVVCLAPPQGSNAPSTIVQQIVTSGLAWVSTAQFQGEPVVRACVTHGETSAADIDMIIDGLLEAARPTGHSATS
jgi:glutamate/tyrosine decarboxylase-like PLP-dependent enzyme